MAQSKAVAKKKSGDVVPSAFFETEYTGFDHVDNESLVIPFLRIAQTNTAQADEDEASHIDGLRPGMFYNTAAGKAYGKEVRLILLGYWRTFVKWGNDLGDFKGSMTPEEFSRIEDECTRDGGMFIDGEGNRYQDTRNFFVLLPDHMEDGPLIYPMKSAGITQSKRLLTRASSLRYQGKKPPLFAAVWKVGTTKNTNDKGTWFEIGDKKGLNAEQEGWVPEELQQPVLEAVELVKDYIANADKIDFSNAQEGNDEDKDAAAF